MPVIAIDPGPEASAWCEFNNGIPVSSDKWPNGDLLVRLRSTSSWPLTSTLAVEMIASYGMPVGREVFETCLWIGRFLEAWSHRGGPTLLVYRKEVKLFLCGSVRAKDANIRAALLDRYGPGKEKAVGFKKKPGPLYGVKGDQWSALAVAVTATGGLR